MFVRIVSWEVEDIGSCGAEPLNVWRVARSITSSIFVNCIFSKGWWIVTQLWKCSVDEDEREVSVHPFKPSMMFHQSCVSGRQTDTIWPLCCHHLGLSRSSNNCQMKPRTNGDYNSCNGRMMYESNIAMTFTLVNGLGTRSRVTTSYIFQQTPHSIILIKVLL